MNDPAILVPIGFAILVIVALGFIFRAEARFEKKYPRPTLSQMIENVRKIDQIDIRRRYWTRMFESVQSLAAGIKSPAFSAPGDEARTVTLGNGTIHDAHSALSMSLSGRYSMDDNTRIANAVGFRTMRELEAALVAEVERLVTESRS